MQAIEFTSDVKAALSQAIANAKPDRIFTLCDTTTQQRCLPLVEALSAISGAQHITISPGDENKTLATAASVWQSLQQGRATRHSLLVNIGGGMTTDLGGFAAAAFKRGIRFINLPTSLLAMVDASVGGKTGVNFGGLKNEIGFFCEASLVIIATEFLSTLDRRNMLSGYAEMLKHSLLHTTALWAEHLNFDISAKPDLAHLTELIKQSIEIKQDIVSRDPHEHSIRKALNLGHTIGHAIESLSIKQGSPMLHGEAVAWGLVGELFLSTIECGFDSQKLAQTASFVRQNYTMPTFDCKHYDALVEAMHHDKKNSGSNIHFTLLSDIGQIEIDRVIDDATIRDALDYILQG